MTPEQKSRIAYQFVQSIVDTVLAVGDEFRAAVPIDADSGEEWESMPAEYKRLAVGLTLTTIVRAAIAVRMRGDTAEAAMLIYQEPSETVDMVRSTVRADAEFSK